VPTYSARDDASIVERVATSSRLEGPGAIRAKAVKRRCYRLTPAGKKQLAQTRREWHLFFRALDRVGGHNALNVQLGVLFALIVVPGLALLLGAAPFLRRDIDGRVLSS
jgi:hypothetical protein